ncbi:PP2C family protein-serine/threonine phosphatase [Amygdalobacter nucleatus]|uniref:Protein phosphatase 2C n=1 Tax=Amygdalobacter nucleatus TaxID=3029274 RepID=A0A133YGW4_9FIRM|nr:protein phosphatase 2C domain-containing protein [Amygdalobacter nucleatus]KXB42434.1 protein phosphatase 2C [Amygdalobacter nucleatus]MDF0486008.1 protein phosphatase 2C domain-containing protein [Amygdalobacter nucleatus]
MIKYRVIAISETGAVRDNNEDNLYLNGEWRHGSEVNVPYWHYLDKTTDASLFVVCDGMGGESYGEEASLIAVSGLSAIEDRLRHSTKQDFADLMESYLLMVNQEICDRVRSHNGLRMGTTFSSLLIRQKVARCINLGDSRIYLFRQGKLKQLTVDQTQAQKLADLGLIPQSEVKTHPEHNRLVQHLGIFPNEYKLEPALSPEITLQEGDYFLLCSDGLTDMLLDESIRKILASTTDIKLAAEDLVQKAIIAGGKDNITVILVAIDALSDERLMKTGQHRILSSADFLAQTSNSKTSQDTRQDPQLRMKLNEALLENMQTSNLASNVAKTRQIGEALEQTEGDEKPIFTVDAEIKHLAKGISNIDMLQYPYLNYQKLEEKQALAEAEVHEKKVNRLKNTETKRSLSISKSDTQVDLPADLGKTRRVDLTTDSKDKANDSAKEASKSENVLISRVIGSNTNASSLSFFAENRTPTEPITTDDLERFELARQEALKRQAKDKGKQVANNLVSEPKVEANSQTEKTKDKQQIALQLLTSILISLLVFTTILFVASLYWFYAFDFKRLWQDIVTVFGQWLS